MQLAPKDRIAALLDVDGDVVQRTILIVEANHDLAGRDDDQGIGIELRALRDDVEGRRGRDVGCLGGERRDVGVAAIAGDHQDDEEKRSEKDRDAVHAWFQPMWPRVSRPHAERP